MDITIKNCPEGAEDNVKKMAMVAIERFLRTRDVKVTKAVQDKFETDVDAILVANTLDKKYEDVTEEKVIEKVVVKQ